MCMREKLIATSVFLVGALVLALAFIGASPAGAASKSTPRKASAVHWNPVKAVRADHTYTVGPAPGTTVKPRPIPNRTYTVGPVGPTTKPRPIP